MASNSDRNDCTDSSDDSISDDSDDDSRNSEDSDEDDEMVALFLLASLLVCAWYFFIRTGTTYEGALAQCRQVVQQAAYIANQQKRGRMDDDGNVVPKRRRVVIDWEWERARICIKQDFFPTPPSPLPKFDDRMFERTFRVTRSIVEEILSIAQRNDCFFREQHCIFRRSRTIFPYAKILFPLQMLAYGTSPSAHQAYYQMGETTARHALKRLCSIIVGDEDLRCRLFGGMTKSDARKTTALHLRKHGVEGMVGSLDCMHVAWKNCPVAWQGSHMGKEGYPTIVLEAMADYNLFFWHASFGWAGTNNDINIWEGSTLQKGFLDGSWSESVDFPFQINNQSFDKLYVLVDGIYPELSRFVKTIQEPVLAQHNYCQWQEASRKDIERAFGVLQRKFAILVKAVELHYKEDIKDIAYCCIMLHNWMVLHRIQDNEEESVDYYEEGDDEPGDDQDRDELDRERATTDQHDALVRAFYNGTATNFDAVQQQIRDSQLDYRYQVVQKRWEKLHDKEEFRRLRNALISQVMTNSVRRLSIAVNDSIG